MIVNLCKTEMNERIRIMEEEKCEYQTILNSPSSPFYSCDYILEINGWGDIYVNKDDIPFSDDIHHYQEFHTLSCDVPIRFSKNTHKKNELFEIPDYYHFTHLIKQFSYHTCSEG